MGRYDDVVHVHPAQKLVEEGGSCVGARVLAEQGLVDREPVPPAHSQALLSQALHHEQRGGADLQHSPRVSAGAWWQSSAPLQGLSSTRYSQLHGLGSMGRCSSISGETGIPRAARQNLVLMICINHTLYIASMAAR